MHFSREKLKEQAGWIILGFVILVALGFLGYQQLNGRVVEAQQEATRWESEATGRMLGQVGSEAIAGGGCVVGERGDTCKACGGSGPA